MYGILLESVQQVLRDGYGDAAWRRVLVEAGLSPHSVFEVHGVYADGVLPTLADACSMVLCDGQRSADEFLAEFGRSFVGYTSRLGYAPVMRATGRYFRDFLTGIDNLHETMRFSYPRMVSPSFYVSAEDERGCYLHYRLLFIKIDRTALSLIVVYISHTAKKAAKMKIL